MNTGIQNKLLLIGNDGCYFLSLLKGTGKSELDILTYFDILNDKKLLKGCTVQNSKKIVEYLLDKEVSYYYYPTKPKYNEFDLVVEEWKNPRTGFTHFRLKDWDSLEDSVTVKEGFILSWRCFKWT